MLIIILSYYNKEINKEINMEKSKKLSSQNKINLSSINCHIDALIDNLDIHNIDKNIDLILDGGLFNGGYQMGCILYLKKLETNKIINIHRISGCSIGSLLGFCFLIDKIDLCIDNYKKIIEYLRENNNLKIFEKILRKIVINDDYCLDKINNKLFITYHEIKNTKQIVKNYYESKEELFETILKSCYIPYIINDELYYKGNYFDGISPYIFPKSDNRLIFINLISVDKFFESFIIKNEKNIITRLLTGIVDIDNLYHNKKTIFCSYIDKWKSYDYIILRLRNILFVLSLVSLEYIIKIYNNIPDNVKNGYIISNFKIIMKYLCNDFLKCYVL